MCVIIFLISFIVFLDTLGYAVYEIKQNKNINGGISVIIISIVSLFFPGIMCLIR